MASNNVIVVSEVPKGHFIEGYMKVGDGAFKPGQVLQIDASAELIDGRPQYKLWNPGTDGARSEFVVVRENDLLGMDAHTGSYEAGSRFLGYVPGKGDEVQFLFKNVGTGTGAGQEDVALGDKLIFDTGTGKVIVTTGSPEEEPLTAMEALANVTEDTLVLCRVR